MKRRAQGLTLAEVMIALFVLALGVVPLFALTTGAHEDTSDAVLFLSLLDRLDEALATGAPAADGARHAVVTEGPRELAQTARRADPYASFAPVVAPPVAP